MNQEIIMTLVNNCNCTETGECLCEECDCECECIDCENEYTACVCGEAQEFYKHYNCQCNS